VKNERNAFQTRIRRLGDDPVRAIPEYITHLERDPDDWTAVNGLAELYLRIGEDEAALTLLGRLGGHLQQEGFLARAAAVFKRVLRIRPDDLALLNLADIAAQEGRLVEAKQYLLQLERERRDRGDIAGADQCLASLDALIRVNTEAPAADVQLDPAARGGVATVEPPPDEAGAPSVQDGEPTSVDALLDAGVAPSEEASAGFAPSAADPRPDTASGQGGSGTAEQPRTSPPARRPSRAGTKSRRSSSPPAKSLQSVFNDLREKARQSDAEAAAHEHFDRAQYHLQDGNETGAMAELRMAAEAPSLRFAAAAQLGRLHIGRGEMTDGIAWLERASQSPPVSPDEGLAVLYELADALERQSERARALAALTVLEGRRRGYRDVKARIAALSAPSTDTPT
jgi:tetratricopeptide (TPR) repeat protein